jgi:hypothetical protein
LDTSQFLSLWGSLRLINIEGRAKASEVAHRLLAEEKYCAHLLGLWEAERFLAVGDERLSRCLNPSHLEGRRAGRSDSLPDLLSVKTEETGSLFRLREVKYKLEERLVAKALRQLESGIRCVQKAFGQPMIDRVEVVIVLRERKLKQIEREFLGERIAPYRYHLFFRGAFSQIDVEGREYPVTVLTL